MSEKRHARIFSNLNRDDLIGRDTILERTIRAALEYQDLMLLAAPHSGLSEILRQSFDRLFFDQQEIIPFYFEFRQSDRSIAEAIRRFDRECLAQVNAFRRRDPDLATNGCGVSEAARLAAVRDVGWLDAWIENSIESESSGQTTGRLVPAAASLAGNRVVVFLDNLDTLGEVASGMDAVAEFCELLTRANVGVIAGGRRRALYAITKFPTLSVENHDFESAGRLAEFTARSAGVAVTEQSRDLIAVQLGGNAGNIVDLVRTAVDMDSQLETFEQVEKCYTEALFGGRIGRRYDMAISSSLAPGADPHTLLTLLNEALTSERGSLPASYWRRNSRLSPVELDAMLRVLHRHEIIDRSDSRIAVDRFDSVLRGYIEGRKRLDLDAMPRARAVGMALAANVRSAPAVMARYYRLNAAIDLRGLMGCFDGRRIADGLLDYGTFRERLKGLGDKELAAAVESAERNVELPRFVYTTNTSNLYPDLAKLLEPERSSTAMGSAGGQETAWIAAQIDSKLEATAETAAFWLDRLEAAAIAAEFESYRLWLIAPEGFTADALALIAERDGIGSSHQQVKLLAGMLGRKVPDQSRTDAGETYEIAIPMGEETEMIAARTIEEIARRHNISSKQINQMKTALVEACINAAEHSLSPDRRIRQTITVHPDRMVITVANRGLRLIDKPDTPRGDDERRGWGLQLMKKLMDEVVIERTDDGTIIRMTKLRREAAPAPTAA